MRKRRCGLDSERLLFRSTIPLDPSAAPLAVLAPGQCLQQRSLDPRVLDPQSVRSVRRGVRGRLEIREEQADAGLASSLLASQSKSRRRLSRRGVVVGETGDGRAPVPRLVVLVLVLVVVEVEKVGGRSCSMETPSWGKSWPSARRHARSGPLEEGSRLVLRPAAASPPLDATFRRVRGEVAMVVVVVVPMVEVAEDADF